MLVTLPKLPVLYDCEKNLAFLGVRVELSMSLRACVYMFEDDVK